MHYKATFKNIAERYDRYVETPISNRISEYDDMVLNLVIVALFLFNLGIRYNASATGEMFGVLLSIVAIGLMAVSGWLGGSLVYVHRMGIAAEPKISEIDKHAA